MKPGKYYRVVFMYKGAQHGDEYPGRPTLKSAVNYIETLLGKAEAAGFKYYNIQIQFNEVTAKVETSPAK